MNHGWPLNPPINNGHVRASMRLPGMGRLLSRAEVIARTSMLIARGDSRPLSDVRQPWIGDNRYARNSERRVRGLLG